MVHSQEAKDSTSRARLRTAPGRKPWTLPDGTDVLISSQFEFTQDANGDILVYAKGDRNAQPSGRLPCGGFYVDAIVFNTIHTVQAPTPTENLPAMFRAVQEASS